jgi:hypothetical protein
MMVEDLLECDLAIELGIERHEDSAQASARMGPEHLESLSVGRGGSHGVAGGPVGIFSGLGGSCVDAEMGNGGFDIAIAESGKASAGGMAGVDGREAPFWVAAVLLEVHGDESVDHISLIRLKIAAGDQMFGQWPVLVASPGLKGCDKLDLVDQAVLKREQAEEQITR